LVVAFDSRLHQLATEWTPTVQLLLAKKTPCIFTSCSKEEAKLDVEHLESMGAKMIWKEEWNKWTGLRVENYFEGDPCRFENAFWLGFQGTASD
jgi:mitochondrial splicing suppressor protein 51